MQRARSELSCQNIRTGHRIREGRGVPSVVMLSLAVMAGGGETIACIKLLSFSGPISTYPEIRGLYQAHLYRVWAEIAF